MIFFINKYNDGHYVMVTDGDTDETTVLIWYRETGEVLVDQGTLVELFNRNDSGRYLSRFTVIDSTHIMFNSIGGEFIQQYGEVNYGRQ